MGLDDASAGLAQLIVLRVVIRAPDVETFVQKYCRFLKDDRIFIFTKAAQPPGTRVRFILELADGRGLMSGEGTVTRVRPDKGDPSKPPGMELRFQPIDDESRGLVQRMLEARGGVRASALPNSGPLPLDRKAGSEPAPLPLPPQPGVPTGPLPLSLPTQPGAASAPLSLAPQPGAASAPLSLAPQPGATPARSFAPGEDASTKVRVPEAKPPAGADLTPPPGSLDSARLRTVGGQLEERTDVDPSASGERRRLETMPPPFTASPTPLPAPLPPSTLLTPPHGVTLPVLEGTSPSGVPALRESAPVPEPDDEAAAALPTVEAPPRVTESWCGPLPPPPGTPAPPLAATVPANPFGEVSDGAIEYFIEWSLEQSTAPKPTARSAVFANVPMRPPRAERPQAGQRRTLLWAGMLIGLILGVPLGAVATWTLRPVTFVPDEQPELEPSRRARAPAPVKAAAQPEPSEGAAPAPEGAAGEPAQPEAPAAEAAKLAAEPKAEAPGAPQKPEAAPVERAKRAAAEPPSPEPATAEPKPEPAATESPKAVLVAAAPAHEASAPEPPSPEASAAEPHERAGATVASAPRRAAKLATLRVLSTPAGAEVLIKGEPRGRTPLDLELAPNHRYEVTLQLPGTKPWKRRVNLKPPLTEVSATLK